MSDNSLNLFLKSKHLHSVMVTQIRRLLTQPDGSMASWMGHDGLLEQVQNHLPATDVAATLEHYKAWRASQQSDGAAH